MLRKWNLRAFQTGRYRGMASDKESAQPITAPRVERVDQVRLNMIEFMANSRMAYVCLCCVLKKVC